MSYPSICPHCNKKPAVTVIQGQGFCSHCNAKLFLSPHIPPPSFPKSPPKPEIDISNLVQAEKKKVGRPKKYPPSNPA